MPFSSMTSGTRPSTRSSISRQRRRMVARAADPSADISARRPLPDVAVGAGQPLEVAVVEHDRHAVARQMHVAFDGVASARRLRRRPAACSPTHLGSCRESRDGRSAGQSARKYPTSIADAHSTSMIASISTAALSGSDAMPTAARACLPARRGRRTENRRRRWQRDAAR